MELFDYPRQESFINSESDSEVGFSFRVDLAGEILKDNFKSTHHILFVMSGCIEVQCDDFTKVFVETMETIFLPKSSLWFIKVIRDTKLVVFSFDGLNDLDRVMFQGLQKHVKDIEYNLSAFSVRGCMKNFLQLLVGYCEDGLNRNIRLHDVKQNELFMLFRKYYSNIELANLFYPIIGVDMDFKNKVLNSYLKAKTSQQLADINGYSLVEFRRRFKENFHEPVYRWMQKQKGKRIQYELLVGNDDMTTIAFRYGFSSSSHFNKFCQSHFGMSPTELKNKLKCSE